MFEKLKKDSVPLGIIIGLLIPAILFSILFFVNTNYFPKKIPESSIFIISLCANLFPFRYYMVNLKFDYTGRGILVVTFVYAIIFLTRYLN